MLKVSIIIPVYNVMDVLDKTIKNILKQTYKNIEIILVDNNSKDDSFKYIKELEKKDNRVKALKEEKQGPNYARKTGFLNATGDYILFCDSDDYLKEDAIHNFVKEIEKSNADVVIGNYIEISEKREVIKTKKGVFFNKDIDNLKSKKELLFVKPALWNKIFKKDLIKEEFFIESKIGEDMVITLSAIMLSEKVKYIDKDIYEYVISDDGLSNSVTARNLLDIIITADQLKSISKKNKVYDEYREEIEFVIFSHIIYKILRIVMMDSKDERNRVYNELRNYLIKNNEYKKNKYYKKKIHYRIANFILMKESIYKLGTTQFLLKQIFTNKILYNIFKKLDM